MALSQSQLVSLVHEVLNGEYVSFKIGSFQLNEDIEAKTATLCCTLADSLGGSRGIEGQGVGMVDALFKGLKQALAPDYPSLGHIHFADFAISGDFGSGPERGENGTETLGHVKLVVKNTAGRTFRFRSESPSITAGTVDVVLEAAEHFVNAELAVLRIYDWIEDAKARNRPDLADRYTQRLADLVKNATYSEAIEKKRREHRV